MRYLSRIVFINSAAIRYADIGLDGNIHFIGTQGVGKSTVLRAILFFYNADTQKLGISKEKKLFADYYFPFANSYILYEVARETGPCCVMAFKSQGRVAFRFIDSGFNREHYIDTGGKAFESWDKIRAGLDRQGIGYTRKIDRYEEYRDILYGNTEGRREYRKYALLETRQYQNIARTIQNVFLNARLEAEFIKQTIIRSMSEEDIEINLQTYLYELRDFDAHLADIRRFRQSAKQADDISQLHDIIKHLEKEKTIQARRLSWAAEHARSREPLVAASLAEEEKKREAVMEKISDIEKRFAVKREKMRDEIAVLQENLRKIRERTEHYGKINIDDIIRRVEGKKPLEEEASDLKREEDLLTSRFREITGKYVALERELEVQAARFENSNEKDRLRAEAEFLEVQEEIKGRYDKLIAQIVKQHEAKLKEAEEARDQRQSELHRLKERKAELKSKRFFEEETERVQSAISNLRGSQQEAETNRALIKGEIELHRSRAAIEEKGLAETFDLKRARLEEGIAPHEARITGIDERLEKSRDSFYSWLNERYPGWERSIGKVCDEAVLFTSGLSPELVGEDGGNFFGVRLDLLEIDRTVRTVADYEKEREGRLADLEALRQEIAELSLGYQDDLDRLKKRYASRLREKQDSLRMQEYLLQQTVERLKAEELNLADLIGRASKEKKAEMERMASEIARASEEELAAREVVGKIKEEIRKQIDRKEREKRQRIQELSEKKAGVIARLDLELRNYREDHESVLKDLAKRKEAELSEKGADTGRINQITGRLAVISEELRFIEANRDLVAVYRQEKKDLIDRGDEFKHAKQLLEEEVDREEQKYLNKRKVLVEEKAAIEEEIRSLASSLEKIKEDLSEFETFRQVKWFAGVADFLKDADPAYQTEERCKALIPAITTSHYEIIERINGLRGKVTKFLGNFSDRNIFQFRISLSTDDEHLLFAEELARFIEDDRISEYEKRVNERYADIVRLIAKETTELTSREGEIQSVIGKINRDITEKNFVGVIQKIELKLDESAHRVVQVLKMIKQFHDEYGLMLGAANLFSWQDQDEKNRKAVELLTLLVKEIVGNKRDFVSLSDSFELKFRIIENQNDTGWVERLSNVGSEGTDVLVKAMLNIMLLNVFKEGASKRFKDFKLHCMMDEIGRLHPGNVRGILKFANDRNILLINGSPTEHDALAYRHIYKLEKDAESITRVKRIVTQHSQP